MLQSQLTANNLHEYTEMTNYENRTHISPHAGPTYFSRIRTSVQSLLSNCNYSRIPLINATLYLKQSNRKSDPRQTDGQSAQMALHFKLAVFALQVVHSISEAGRSISDHEGLFRELESDADQLFNEDSMVNAETLLCSVDLVAVGEGSNLVKEELPEHRFRRGATRVFMKTSL